MNTKATLLTFCTLATLALNLTAAPPKPTPPPFKDDADNLGYAIGLNLGVNLKHQDVAANTDMIIRGLRDAYTNASPLMTDQEALRLMSAYQRQLAVKRQAKFEADAATNKVAGEAFQAANKVKPGVVTTPSGLQYRVEKEGTGETPKNDDLVDVYYHARLLDGTVFESSDRLRKPAVFTMNAAMPGVAEALKLMKTGSKLELVIPPELAYGSPGRPPLVGGDATILYDIEILGIHKPLSASNPMTSDIIRVPSSAEMEKGAKPKALTAAEVEKLRLEYEASQKTQKVSGVKQ